MENTPDPLMPEPVRLVVDGTAQAVADALRRAGAELGISAARIADTLLSVPIPVAREAPQYWAASIIRQTSDLLRAEGGSRLPS